MNFNFSTITNTIGSSIGNIFKVNISFDIIFGFIFTMLYLIGMFVGIYFVNKVLNKKFEKHYILNKYTINHFFKFLHIIVSLYIFIECVKFIIDIFPSIKETLAIFLNNTGMIKKVIMIIFMGTAFYFLIKDISFNYISYWNEENKKNKIAGRPIKEIDASKIDLIGKFLTIILFVILALITMSTFGISMGSLAAIGGASGLILGFATKDLLSNFFGLFSLYLDRPFKLNDNIKIKDKNISGTVEEIGLRTTKIRTSDETELYLPNSIFNTSVIDNLSRSKYKIFKHEFKISNEIQEENQDGLMKENNNDKEVDILKKLQILFDKISNDVNLLEFVIKDSSKNPRIYISHISDVYINIVLKINFTPTPQDVFEKNFENTMYLIYKNFKDNGFKVIEQEV